MKSKKFDCRQILLTYLFLRRRWRNFRHKFQFEREHYGPDTLVHVYSFYFTKAYDTVRHDTLMNKMTQLSIADNIYNWIKEFFQEHFHCTRYAGECSTVAAVKASVIQGSGLGPVSFIVTAFDLRPKCTAYSYHELWSFKGHFTPKL